MDRININDNERFSYKPSMNNENNVPSKRKGHDAVDATADRLVALFKSPESRRFYCLVAYTLPQATIDRLVTTAVEKGKVHGALFNYLAREEMRRTQ